MIRYLLARVFLFTLLWALGSPGTVHAQALPYTTSSIISNNVLSNVRGRAAVNMAAGDANIQSNAASLAVGLGQSDAIASNVTDQRAALGSTTTPADSVAAINGSPFSSATGLISVNQTSGAANAQTNSAAFGVGTGAEVVADSTLATDTSNAVPAATGTGTGSQTASISDTAFDGARGLVQLNQSAGSGNSTANNFALVLQTGANP